LKYHQEIANAYDLMRVVFFNQWKDGTIFEIKDKAELLSEDLIELAFVKDLEGLKGEKLDEARWEYNRLFIGPKKPIAVPFESVYRSEKHLLMREFAYEVREFYAQVGLEVEKKDHFPDDFIGFEFQYLFYVSKLVIELIKHKREKEAEELILVRKEFLQEHPLKWFFDFCDDISKGSKEKIWKNLAEFILKILEKEKAFFENFLLTTIS